RRTILQRRSCSPRCCWLCACNNRNLISQAASQSNQAKPFRQAGFRPVKSRPSLILHKKTFEYSRRGNYLEDVNATTRCAAVAIAICSWIAVSNHCAFAAVATEIDKAQTECPFHSKPAKQREQSSQVQCCKVLRAVVLAKSKDWARDDAKFCNANFPVQAGVLLVYSSRPVAPLLLDTGPPLRAFPLAELILQQSLFAP